MSTKQQIKPIKEELKSIVTVIANMVYGYQGSDPKIIAKQVGTENAIGTLDDIISQLLLDHDKQLADDVKKPIKEIITNLVYADDIMNKDEIIEAVMEDILSLIKRKK